jgi:hypothetical protein
MAVRKKMMDEWPRERSMGNWPRGDGIWPREKSRDEWPMDENVKKENGQRKAK